MTDQPRILRPALRGGLEPSEPLTFPKPKRPRIIPPPDLPKDWGKMKEEKKC